MSQLMPYIFIIVIVSFLGFITENLWVGMRYGYFDNRGMRLPGLLGYGLAMVFMYLVLGTPENPRLFNRWLELDGIHAFIYYIVMSAVIVSLGEILLGKSVEHFCKLEWWNYQELPLHIGKYTTVPTSMGFGLLITVFMKCFFPRIILLANSMYESGTDTSMLIIFIAYFWDFLYAAYFMISNKKINQIWKYNIHKKEFQMTERLKRNTKRKFKA